MAGSVEPPRLELRSLSKSFGGTQALRGVDLSVLPGEVHGLLGENGSGKSTLIKMLAGFHDPDDGELLIDGEPVRLPLARGSSASSGMSFVHQDLGLIESLSVLENLRMAEIASSRSRFRIRGAGSARRARETFERYGVRIDPTRVVGGLKPVERALLAIVRAIEEIRGVGAGQGVLVLDEPTVFLPREGIERAVLARPRGGGRRGERSSSSRTTSTRCARSPIASPSSATARRRHGRHRRDERDDVRRDDHRPPAGRSSQTSSTPT